MKHSHLRKLLAGLMAAAVVSLGAGGALTPPAVATQPGSPGVTQPGTVVFAEDFENGTNNTALGAQSYAAAGSATYVGSSGVTYTGSPSWIDAARCNGVILSYRNSATPPWALSGSAASGTNNRCADLAGVRSYQFLRMLAKGMGQQFNPGSPDTDHVTSSFTECVSNDLSQGSCDTLPSGPAGGVMFKTVNPLPTTPGHYYTFGVDTAYMNCFGAAADPSYQFARIDGDGTVTPIGTALNGCQASQDPNVQSYQQRVTSDVGGNFGTVTRTVNIKSMLTNQAFQAPGTSMGLEMWNNNGTTNGNDGAFDNVRLVDVTPQLDKRFSRPLIAPGGTATLTFTVTNTSELNAKNDWFLTDSLPAGLAVAATPNIGGTCVQSAGNPLTTTAVAGTGVISVTGGDLASGQASCTITVDVTSDTDGSYVNGGANVVTNLKPPANATLVVASAPRITVSKALGAPRLADSDQFTMEIRSGSAAGQVVNSTANSTTSGAGSAVTPGSGTTGKYAATAGSTYFLTESGPNLAAYQSVITCTDSRGLQQGLPSAAAFHGSFALTPVAGADIKCVLTNTALPVPGLEFSKSAAAPARAGPSVVGDQIAYHFTAKNTGNVKLTKVSIDDPMAGLSPLVYSWPGSRGELLPGEVVTAQATYPVTQADLDAGHVTNRATATGTPPTGPAITPPPASTDTPLWPNTALEFSKTVDAGAVGDPAKVGDILSYKFAVKNAGSGTFTGVAIQDPMTGLSGLTFDWPGTPGQLQPGQTMTATATYAITPADVAAGKVVNSAAATGTSPSGLQVVTPSATAVVTFPPVVQVVPVPPGRAGDSLASTGVVLAVLPIGALVLGGGVFLLLGGRRKRTGAR